MVTKETILQCVNAHVTKILAATVYQILTRKAAPRLVKTREVQVIKTFGYSAAVKLTVHAFIIHCGMK